MTTHYVDMFVGRLPKTRCGIFVENGKATANANLVDCKKCIRPKPAHSPHYQQRPLGSTPAGGRLVGYLITCSCGWSMKINENKRSAKTWFNDHVREVRQKSET
jgi:hypothetical protein